MDKDKILRTVTVALTSAAIGAGVNLALAVLLVSTPRVWTTLGLPALSSDMYLAQGAIPAAALAGAASGAVFSGWALRRGGLAVTVAMTLVTYVVAVLLAFEAGIAFQLASHPDTCDAFFRICGTDLYGEGWFLAPLYLALGLPFMAPIFGGAMIWSRTMRVVFGRPEPRFWGVAPAAARPAPLPLGIAWAGPSAEQAASLHPAADASAPLAEDATPLETRLYGVVLASMIGLVSAIAIKIGLGLDSPGLIGPIDRFVLGAVVATGAIGGVLAVEVVGSRSFLRKVAQMWVVVYVANFAIEVIFSILDVAIAAPGGRTDCFSGPCGVHRVNDMAAVLLFAPVLAFWMLPVAVTLLAPAALWVWLMRRSFRRPIERRSEQSPQPT